MFCCVLTYDFFNCSSTSQLEELDSSLERDIVRLNEELSNRGKELTSVTSDLRTERDLVRTLQQQLTGALIEITKETRTLFLR